MIKGSCGRTSSIGNVIVQVPFKYLNVVYQYALYGNRERYPSLLSVHNMLNNGLDISIQVCYLSLEEWREPLTVKKYFLTHSRSSAGVTYVLYTEQLGTAV